MLQTLTKAKLDERVFDSFPYYASTKINPDKYESFVYYDSNKKQHDLYVGRSHINEWTFKFKRILGKYITEQCEVYVAGGSVLTYILYGNELMIRDFDIFLKTERDFTQMDAHLKKLSPDNIVENENTRHFTFKTIEIDLIKKPSASLSELLNRFDFDICRVGFTINASGGWEFKNVINFTTIFSLTFNIDRISDIDFKTQGIKAFRRIIKYTKKGFSPSYGLITNFFAAILLDNQNIKIGSEEFKAMKIELEKQISKDYEFFDKESLDDDFSFNKPQIAPGKPTESLFDLSKRKSGSYVNFS
jgi:hypothetical protein